MIVLAIDPGEKIGWVRAHVDDGQLVVEGHGVSQIKPFVTALHKRQVGDEPYDLFVVERYRIAAGKAREHIGSDVPTLQCIGMVRLCAWLGHTRVVFQPPAAMRGPSQAAMPDWLRAIIDGLPASHDESHDGSALRHLWDWYFREHYDPTQEPA